MDCGNGASLIHYSVSERILVRTGSVPLLRGSFDSFQLEPIKVLLSYAVGGKDHGVSPGLFVHIQGSKISMSKFRRGPCNGAMELVKRPSVEYRVANDTQ